MFCGKHEEWRQINCKMGRNGRMFTFDVNMPQVNSMLFIGGKGVGDIGIWHKWVGHVNFQRFKFMEK